MARKLIHDSRGNVPTYVMHRGELIHQPSGLSVPLPTPALDSEIHGAKLALVKLVEEREDEYRRKIK